MRYHLHHGDSREILKTLEDNSVDSIVCDPPYHLTNRGGGPHGKGADNPYSRSRAGAASSGFMGMTWDGGDVAQDPAFWAEALRLVTPKGGLVLDPFMGSGSTGKAAMLEGFAFIGIDLTAEYVEIARARIDFALRQGHQPSLLTEEA